MDYSVVCELPVQFLALASLNVAEFDDLLTDFAPAWKCYYRYHILDGALQWQHAH